MTKINTVSQRIFLLLSPIKKVLRGFFYESKENRCYNTSLVDTSLLMNSMFLMAYHLVDKTQFDNCCIGQVGFQPYKSL